MDALARFLLNVDRSGGPDACHPWVGNRFQTGYGRFYLGGRSYQAHRWILGVTRGEPLRWDDTMREMACHTCDYKPCCNPKHLYAGDARQNVADAVERRHHFTVSESEKTHCKNGHEFTESNIYRHPTTGSRQCRECRKLRQRQPGKVRMADRTHCPKGHPYDEENTRVRARGSRDCRTCHREWERARRAERRAA
jgi:hypothetical protein